MLKNETFRKYFPRDGYEGGIYSPGIILNALGPELRHGVEGSLHSHRSEDVDLAREECAQIPGYNKQIYHNDRCEDHYLHQDLK